MEKKEKVGMGEEGRTSTAFPYKSFVLQALF